MDSVTSGVLEEIVEFCPAIKSLVRRAKNTPGGDAAMHRAVHQLARLLMLAKCLSCDVVAEAAFEDAVFSGLADLRANGATVMIVEQVIALDGSTVEDIDLCAPAEVITRRKAFILSLVRNGC